MQKEIKIKVIGKKGDSPTTDELVSLITPLIPEPLKGEKGDNGVTPTRYEIESIIKPLIPVVKDGETPTDEHLISLIKPLIPEPESVVIKINESNTKIKKEVIDVDWNKEYKVEDIKGLPEKLKKLEYSHAKAKNDYEQVHGGGGNSTPTGVQSIVAGTNITVDDTDPLNPIVSATGGVTGATNSTLTLTGTTLGLNLSNANTWLATQTFRPTTTSSVGLSIQLLAGQTGRAFQVLDSTGAISLVKIDPYMTASASNSLFEIQSGVNFDTPIAPFMFGSFFAVKNSTGTKVVDIYKSTGSAGDINLAIRNASGSTSMIFSNSSGVVSFQKDGVNIFRVGGSNIINFESIGASVGTFDQNGTATLTVTDTATTRIGILIKDIASQTADSFRIHNSAGATKVALGGTTYGLTLVNPANNTSLRIATGDGSAAAAGFVSFICTNTVGTTYSLTMSTSSTVFSVPTIAVASANITFSIFGGYGGATLGDSIRFGSNTGNAGNFTATTGTQNTVLIGRVSNGTTETFQPSSGTATYNQLRLQHGVNTTGTYAGTVRGIYVTPTLTSITGASYRAIEVDNNAGFGFYQSNAGASNYFNGKIGIGTTSASAKLHIISTTEQLRLGYDVSNYFSTTVGSTGGVTFDAVGSGAGFTFADDIIFADAKNIQVNTTTGTKIGTATTQKIGFWNATPNVQPTTAITAAAFVPNTSLIFDDSATYGGYTMGQVVAALQRAGLLA